jgi:hypothetical protein
MAVGSWSLTSRTDARLSAEKCLCGAPGAIAVEGAAGVVSGQEAVVDPVVVFRGRLIDYRRRQRYRVGRSCGDQSLQVAAHVVGGGVGSGDGEAIVTGIETGRRTVYGWLPTGGSYWATSKSHPAAPLGVT